MKKFTKILAVLAMTVCAVAVSEQNANAQLSSLFKKAASAVTSSSTTAQSAGSETGAAIKALYSQYKTNKTLDMSNLTTISNVTKLASSVSGLKTNLKDKTYSKDFVKGLILGSSNLVTESNSSSVLSQLKKLSNVDLSSLASAAASSSTAQKASSAVTEAKNISDSVTSLLKIFK
jgi:hypothetical protein